MNGSCKHKLATVPILIVMALLLASCSEVRQPKVSRFFSETPPPARQELRWSNGGLPRTLDPAMVSSPPETDVVRAIFEGLTELHPATLEERPAVAESWGASDDLIVWRFTLRKDARWSNGERVRAEDFVRSWRRALTVREASVHRSLLFNIRGAVQLAAANEEREAETMAIRVPAMVLRAAEEEPMKAPERETVAPTVAFGAVAEDEQTLVVRLVTPDRDFAKLVAHPVFRPVYSDDTDLTAEKVSDDLVSNGPFTLASFDKDGVALRRSENYWNNEAVKLETVRFVPAENSDAALEAYRTGAVDAVTNADFSPLALKLLEPYDDFRRTTFAAINVYEFNIERPAFRDRRVREALAIAIERERLTDGELEGATQPAYSFLPFSQSPKGTLVQDTEKARELLETAGYPDGSGFPTVKLTVNRNDTQIRIAKSVAEMWRRNLNIETEVIVRESSEMETARNARDFDLIRRGVVLPTNAEAANLKRILGDVYRSHPPSPGPQVPSAGVDVNGSAPGATVTSPDPEPGSRESLAAATIANEDDALFQLTAIPLYFPTSYSLVRPFVIGFEANSLDATLLHEVFIDTEWTMPPLTSEE